MGDILERYDKAHSSNKLPDEPEEPNISGNLQESENENDIILTDPEFATTRAIIQFSDPLDYLRTIYNTEDLLSDSDDNEGNQINSSANPKNSDNLNEQSDGSRLESEYNKILNLVNEMESFQMYLSIVKNKRPDFISKKTINPNSHLGNGQYTGWFSKNGFEIPEESDKLFFFCPVEHTITECKKLDPHNIQ